MQYSLKYLDTMCLLNDQVGRAKILEITRHNIHCEVSALFALHPFPSIHPPQSSSKKSRVVRATA
ncbi:hypothetical protein KIN20_019641 [Parelaphostrongylus tenuis]|uniref:Uncharacterized protein n=1 Tax=Parelaphostrongylus tenuis TaxID=148309 RepID=A0AAD5MLA9_PARTN|nr:hypothetical protein KIN20_019641 [Parelaphostrongylus tenuis]